MNDLERLSKLVNDEVEYAEKHKLDPGYLNGAIVIKEILDKDTSYREKKKTLLDLSVLITKGLSRD